MRARCVISHASVALACTSALLVSGTVTASPPAPDEASSSSTSTAEVELPAALAEPPPPMLIEMEPGMGGPHDPYRDDFYPVAEPRSGIGLLVTGVVIDGGIAVPLTLAGFGYLGAAANYDPRDNTRPRYDLSSVFAWNGAILLGAAVGVAAIGTPMLIVGAVRHDRWRRWKASKRMGLGAGGLTLRF